MKVTNVETEIEKRGASSSA